MNLHRSLFDGRNSEYYSTDPFLTGTLAASEISDVKDRGGYAFMKHFALNEQETNFTTCSNKQAVRDGLPQTIRDGGRKRR